MSLSSEKASLRKLIRAKRNALTGEQQQFYQYQLAKRLSQHLKIEVGFKIAGFLSQDGEPNLASVFKNLWAAHAEVFLPVIRPISPNCLWFLPFNESTVLTKNKYQIDEPVLPINQAIRPSHLNAVLMPLVAFDEQGHRLGMGGGFYDRTFAHLRHQKNRPLFVGVAFEEQKVASIPYETWDLPLDGVVTPSKYYSFS